MKYLKITTNKNVYTVEATKQKEFLSTLVNEQVKNLELVEGGEIPPSTSINEVDLFFKDLQNTYKSIDVNLTRLHEPNNTYLITFNNDSKDRLENIHLVIFYLCSITDAKIVLCEMSKTPVLKNRFEQEQVMYFHIDEDFIKTKAINESYKNHIETEWFTMYDCDVLITASQHLSLITSMLDENVDLIIPYDGSYYELHHSKIYDISKNYMNIYYASEEYSKELLNQRFNTDVYVGTGAITCFRSTSFKEVGGMNPNFIKWGIEDDEIVYRFFSLGKCVYRCNKTTKGIIHISHTRLNNGFCSDGTHDLFMDQKKEFIKIKTNNAGENKLYIKTWDNL